MKIEMLEERIEKKAKTIEKKTNTITKKEKAIEKKQKALEKETDERERRYIESDIRWLEDDIRRLGREIEECKVTLAKYEAQLKGEIEKEQTFIKEVPESLKDMEQMLIEKWDQGDKDRREFYNERYEELGYKDFVKQYKYSGYEFMMISDEDIHKHNVKDARIFVLDLLNRVKDITGEVTSWDEVYLTVGNTFPVLNGIVYGKEGKAVVESIYAGGYNIQRLHVRVLVKAC